MLQVLQNFVSTSELLTLIRLTAGASGSPLNMSIDDRGTIPGSENAHMNRPESSDRSKSAVTIGTAGETFHQKYGALEQTRVNQDSQEHTRRSDRVRTDKQSSCH
jgi:hypothetical protein